MYFLAGEEQQDYDAGVIPEETRNDLQVGGDGARSDPPVCYCLTMSYLKKTHIFFLGGGHEQGSLPGRLV